MATKESINQNVGNGDGPMTAAEAHRPVGVAIVATVALVQAILAVSGGLAFMVERNDENLLAHVDVSSGMLTTLGGAAIIWGAVAFFVALGLWDEVYWARIVVAILELFSIGGGIYLLFAWSGTYIWLGIWQIVIGLIVLYFLYNTRAEAYFTQRHLA